MNPQALSTHLADFHGFPVQVIDHDGRQWLSGEQIGTALGLKEPRTGVNRIFNRHRQEIEKAGVAEVNLGASSGHKEVRIYSPRATYAIGFFCQTPLAERFREWVLDVLEDQREVEVNLTSTSQPVLPSTTANTITLSKDKYIQLLETQVHLFQQGQKGGAAKGRPAPTPLSAEEKTQILALQLQGLGTHAIARTLGRSRSAVRNVTREAQAAQGGAQ